MAYLLKEGPGDYSFVTPPLYVLPPRRSSGRLKPQQEPQATSQPHQPEDRKEDAAASTDAMLVLRVQSGDVRAFEELVRRYEPVVRVVAFRGADAECVDDVVQDAFMKAYANISKLESPALFKSWLLQIAANRARDYLRKENRKTRFLKESASEVSWRMQNAAKHRHSNSFQSENTPVEQEEFRALMVEKINSLSAPYRKVATLRFLEDWSFAEIAKFMGLSERSVKQRVWRARAVLKTKLHDRDPWPSRSSYS